MTMLALALAAALQIAPACSAKLPDPAAISAYIAAHPSAFRNRRRYALDQIAIPQTTDRAILKQLEPLHSNDAVASALTAAGVVFTRGPATFDSALAPEDLSQKLAVLPSGEPFVIPANGRFLINEIKSFQAVPMTLEVSRATARNLMLRRSVDDCQRSLDDMLPKQPGTPAQR